MTMARGAPLLALLLSLPLTADGQQRSCRDDTRYGLLDFWLGDWTVRSRGQTVGTNTISKILDGCAVSEHWRGRSGGTGQSLFYFVPSEGAWRQVWVTTTPERPGGVKEKELLETLPGGGVRFQGRVRLMDGSVYLDRTTLTPEEDGTVLQVIEVSGDEGLSWREVFRGRYERKQE